MDLNGTEPLGISVRHDRSGTSVALSGELDVATAPRLRDVVQGVVAAGHTQVVLDLSALRFCDPTGLGEVFGLHHRLEEAGGHLELREPGPMVRKVLKITALDRTFHVVS